MADEPQACPPDADAAHNIATDAAQDLVTDNTLVKIYNLSSGGVWDDGGTGHILYFTPPSEQWSSASFESVSASNGDQTAPRECFAVIHPDDYSDQVISTAHTDGVLLVRPMIQQEIADSIKFIRQGESIVLWTDDAQQRELALSFQSSLGCDLLWSRVHHWQGDNGKSFQDDSPSNTPAASGDAAAGRSTAFPSFDTSLETLKAISEIVEGDVRMSGGYKSLTSQQPQSYWQQYLAGFAQLEVADDTEGIRVMFDTVRNLLVFGDGDMYHKLLDDAATFENLLGVLENDPEFDNRTSHRAVFQNANLFQEPVRLTNAKLREEVHFTFKLIYLKDCVFARFVDDIPYQNLAELIHRNVMTLIDYLQEESSLLKSIVSSCSPSSQSSLRFMTLKMLREFVDLGGRHPALQNAKSPIIQSMLQAGLLRALAPAMEDADQAARVMSFEVLNSLIMPFFSAEVKHAVMSTPAGTRSILDAAVSGLLQDGDEGIKSQSLELILKLCSVDPARAHLDDFLSHFYEKHIAALSGYIGSFVADDEIAKQPDVRISRATTFAYVIEALCDFVKTHNYRLKHCIMQHKIMARVAALCSHPQKHVVLCALRFIKTCIFSDDKFYELHVIKFDILDPIMRVFAQCSSRNNLVASCILDLFERLRKDSSLHKALIENLCTRHGDALRASDVGCVKQLLERYEQHCEHSGNGGASGDSSSSGRAAVHAAPKVARTSLHRAGRDIGDDDESYFDRDTEEDSVALASLVAYDDECDAAKDPHHNLPPKIIEPPPLKRPRQNDDDNMFL